MLPGYTDADGDQIDGSDGNDDIIYALGGDDTIDAGLGDDEVYGGDGNDQISGGVGTNELHGGAGDDTFIGGDGADKFWGGAGQDNLDYSGSDAAINVDLSTGAMSGGDADNDTIVQGIDGVIGSDYDDVLTGFDQQGSSPDDTYTNVLVGGGGDDTIDGRGGDDFLDGGIGSDVIQGGGGDDRIVAGVTGRPDLGYPGLFTGDTDPNDDRDYVDGGDGDDTISTGDDADTIVGGSGDDSIDAGFDADLIDAGEGDDFVVGGEGSDTIDAGAGDDVVYGGLDPIYPDALNIPDDVDLVPNNGMDVIHGGDGNDEIYGQDDADLLFGDAGADSVHGGIDNDTIEGGSGEDQLFGDEGDDLIIGGGDADTMSGGDDRDTFSGITIGDFVDGNEGGDDFDTLDLTGAAPAGGSLNVIYDATNNENGTVEFIDDHGDTIGTMEFRNIENVVCFTPDSRIATPRGERLVQDLRVGDRVITRDNGIQEIRWLGNRAMSGIELAHNVHLRPILIRKGSLGNDLPERDMMVSPNHRVLVANDKTSLYFEEHEVLVAAKHLTGLEGVGVAAVASTSYIHFLFDRHEVVLSDGAWTESFQPGDHSLTGIGNAQRTEIFELFPELKTREGLDSYHAARRSLKKHEAQVLFM